MTLLHKRIALLLALFLWMVPAVAKAAPASQMIGINVLLNAEVTDPILMELGRYGTVLDVLDEPDAVTMKTTSSSLKSIRQLPFVAAANADAVRNGAPIVTNGAADLSQGISTWDLDAINVTEFGIGRTVNQDGTGVYVAVLDTGLVDNWRQYFPEDRIADEYAMSFGGGGGEMGTISNQPNKWEHDQNSHGTHVTSTILGYMMGNRLVNGVAPGAKVIPVKVLNQNGSGWSSVIARGISYVAELKRGPLKDSPVVINMSLGGPALDVVEKAAIDDAVAAGVIIVASAGNEGTAGMGYPGAYQPVISVAASGWTGEWLSGSWWYSQDVTDPLDPLDFYIADFSSRQLEGQDLDVAAPGSWIVGPYQTNGQISYYFMGGTSMASPHVAGIAALLTEKNGTLVQADVEELLEKTAIGLAAGSRTVMGTAGPAEVSWDADATGAGLVDAAAALNELGNVKAGKTVRPVKPVK